VNRGCATAVPYTNYYARARDALPDPRRATRITKPLPRQAAQMHNNKIPPRRRRENAIAAAATTAVVSPRGGRRCRRHSLARRNVRTVHNTEIPLSIIIIVGQHYIIIIVIVFASLQVRLLYTRHVYGGGVDGGRVLLLCFIGGGLPSTIIMMILK